MPQQPPNQPQPDINAAINQKKVLDFKASLEKLSKESGIIVIPVIRSGLLGIYPDMAYLTKEEYDRLLGPKTSQASPTK